MKVLVTGDRDWADCGLVWQELEALDDVELVIQGGARGADACARKWAEGCGISKTVDAKWKQYGKAAGVIRNSEMLDMNPDLVLAFHDSIETSKGTKDCVEKARKKGLSVRLISH